MNAAEIRKLIAEHDMAGLDKLEQEVYASMDDEANDVSVLGDTLTNILKYLRRMEEEWQVIFCVALARHETKKVIAFANREFALWAADNEDLL